MRHAVLTLTGLVAVGLATSTAFAGHGYRGSSRRGGTSNYRYRGHYQYYQPPARYQGYGGPVRHYGYYGYRGPGYQLRGETFGQAVRRIKATYSPYRYNPHPRSLYKSPPHYSYGYRGW